DNCACPSCKAGKTCNATYGKCHPKTACGGPYCSDPFWGDAQSKGTANCQGVCNPCTGNCSPTYGVCEKSEPKAAVALKGPALIPYDPKPQPHRMPPPAPPPPLYRLADASGKIWEHEDPKWLRTWVGQVNARLTRSVPVLPLMQA